MRLMLMLIALVAVFTQDLQKPRGPLCSILADAVAELRAACVVGLLRRVPVIELQAGGGTAGPAASTHELKERCSGSIGPFSLTACHG